MSIPTDTAVRSAARDAGSASETPKPIAASRSLTGAVASPNNSKSDLAGSIQALHELAKKCVPASNGIADEPLAAAYEKRIHTLQDSLKERDQVVQMLTQRLEQAADQLDRLQRTGGARGSNTVAGITPELIENQQVMAEQVKQLLGQWEELQATEMLTRIESRIAELHELVSSGAMSSASASPQTEKEAANLHPKTSAGVSVFSGIASDEPVQSGWEAIKAAVMAGESYTLPTSGSTTAPSNNTPEAGTTASFEETAPVEPPAPQSLPDPPPAVDFDIADQTTFFEAIRDRDEYIAILLRRLSSPDANIEFPDWDKLNFVPEDLHRELLGLRDRLQDKLRVAEVDLSLQRAKLAREDARLTIKADQVARQMKQLGVSPDEPGSNVGGTRALNEGSNATQGRRWLQFLQRSNGSGSGTDGK